MADPDVDRFLNTFQELSSTRFLENDSRMSNLEREVERKRQAYRNSPKKKGKPLVPTKSAALQSSNGTAPKLDFQLSYSASNAASRSIYRDLDIELLNPIARPSDFDSKPFTSSFASMEPTPTEIKSQQRHDSLAELMNQLDVNTSFELPERNKNEPKPIKADDILNIPARTDLTFSPKSSIAVPKRSIKKEEKQSTTKSTASTDKYDTSSSGDGKEDSSSDDDGPEQLEPWKFTESKKAASLDRLDVLDKLDQSDRSTSTIYKSSISSHKSSDLPPPTLPDRSTLASSNNFSSSRSQAHHSSVSSRLYSDKHKHTTAFDRSTSNSSTTSHNSSSYRHKPTPTPKPKPKFATRQIANVALDYIPMPNSMAVMSAVAAAKAPALSPTKIDTTVGERAPDLFMHARFLTDGGASSPTKQLSREASSVSPIKNPLKAPMSSSVISSKPSYSLNKRTVPQPVKKRINDVQEERNVSVVTLTRKLKPTPTPAPKPKLIYTVVSEASTANLKPSKFAKRIESEEKPEALKKMAALSKPKIAPKPEEKIPEGMLRFSTLNKPKPTPKVEKEVPEALKKVGRLNKPKPAPKPQVELPEAMQKFGSLNKPKVAPKPQIELPEALQKFERFRTKINNKLESKISAKQAQFDPLLASPNRSNTFSAAQSSVFALPGLANNQKFQKIASTLNNTIKNSFSAQLAPSTTSSPSPYDTLDDLPPRSISKSKTLDNSELEKEGQKLTHITKGRAKGPKRRLPKKVASTEEDDKKPTSVHVSKVRPATSRKAPPAIRKSSRKVSGGDLFL